MDLFLSNVFFQTSPSQAKLYAFHDVITEGYMTSKFHEISRFVDVRTFYELRFIETLDVFCFPKDLSLIIAFFQSVRTEKFVETSEWSFFTIRLDEENARPIEVLKN